MPTSSSFLKKPLATAQQRFNNHGLTRSLGPVQLVLLGIGCIVGAGVYVMTGIAASHYAGPAIILAFVLAAFACGLTALCYAELSSVIPISGASYSYAYISLGELFAWGLGWMLMLEYWLAGSLLAVGVSGYFTSLLADFAVTIPSWASQSLVQQSAGVQGHFMVTHHVNLVAVIALALVAAVLVRGVRQSVAITALMVALKVGVLVAFVLVGWQHVNTANWQPFIPENEGGFRFGVPGIFRAASILFFSYLGFEAVATAALEAKNPKRDVPIGIIGALLVSSLLYIAVALVITGLVPFRQLNVPDPIALAINVIGLPVMTVVIKVGALTGLMSVLLVNVYAQSRICYAMADDGLIPPLFKRIHHRYKTPYQGTLLVSALAALTAALLPIDILADLVSIGTVCVFMVVSVSLIWLRSTHPELPRPFKVPLGGVWVKGVWLGTVPVLALVFALVMIGPVVVDIVQKALIGNALPLVILALYIVAGAAIYGRYGKAHSKLRQANSR